VNQQALQNVRVPAKEHASHAAGLVEMRERPLQALAAEPQQLQAARHECAADCDTPRPAHWQYSFTRETVDLDDALGIRDEIVRRLQDRQVFVTRSSAFVNRQ